MRKFLLVIAIVAFSCATLWAGDIQLDVKRKVLKNGMRILVLENHTSPVVSTFMRYNVGSVDEKPGITGTAHFWNT